MGKKGIRDLSRRELMKLFGVSVAGTLAGGHLASPHKVSAQSRGVTPRGTVRNCIVIQVCGAMSPQETLDFKEMKDKPDDFKPVKVNADFTISESLFPRWREWAPKAALVRSFSENALVHVPALYHQQAGRAMNPAIAREIPAFGSVIAMELESERRASDTFPTFMSFDLWLCRLPQLGAGMLRGQFAGLDINSTTVFDSFGSRGDDRAATLVIEERQEVLRRMSEVSPTGRSPMGWKADEYQPHYEYAFDLLGDPRFAKVLDMSEEEKQRYGVDQDDGTCKIGLTMLLARNTLAADAGARFLWITNPYSGGNGSFDNHYNMFYRGEGSPGGGTLPIYKNAPRFERAFASLITDLSALPGQEPGKTLLDETLVIISNEFGRTPFFNFDHGRDHWGMGFTNLFIGGGVKPGTIIGKTAEDGGKVIDVGWKHREQPTMDHIVSTIYSVLGIDYSKRIDDTPSGRAYEYQQTAPLGGPSFIPLDEISELFTG